MLFMLEQSLIGFNVNYSVQWIWYSTYKKYLLFSFVKILRNTKKEHPKTFAPYKSLKTILK